MLTVAMLVGGLNKEETNRVADGLEFTLMCLC